MKPLSRKLFLAASLILVITYFVPLWKIILEAPQYPEGVGLNIWLHTIDGQNPNDLMNMNILNHYIGMKEIHPESITELKIMPYLVGFIILLGVIVYLVNRKLLGWTWVILFALLLAAGLYDFYLWEYDYGHNLNPNAAIKVPGMTYQPPLIGSKKLLNFNSISMPGMGGIIMGISLLMGMAALYLDRKKASA